MDFNALYDGKLLFFTSLASTCYSFLKANAMLNVNIASAYFYAVLIIHLTLH